MYGNNSFYIRVFSLLIFLIFCIIPAVTKEKVNRVDIIYGHVDGYAMYKSVASYKLNGHDFILQSTNTHNSELLPMTISEKTINELISNLAHLDKDSCDLYRITDCDIESYKALVHNICSSEAEVFIFKEIDESNYLALSNCDFYKLSCDDIIRRLSYPCSLFSNHKPLIKIIFYISKEKKVEIFPSSCYEGLPWIVHDCKQYYINYDYIMEFLKDIKYDKFFFFHNRGLMILHIANTIIEGLP